MDSSQSSDWHFTPPESPGTSRNYAQVKRIELKAPYFHCMGKGSREHHKCHEMGYIQSGFMKNSSIIEDNDIIELNLFHGHFRFWTGLEHYMDILFYLCRKNFMVLNNTKKVSVQTWRAPLSNSTLESQAKIIASFKLRKKIHAFLNYVYTFIKSSLAYYDRFDKLNQFILRLEEHMQCLQFLLQRLSFVYSSDRFLLSYASIHGNKSTNPTYQIMHCELDSRWQCLMILREIKRAKERGNTGDSQTQYWKNECECSIDDSIMMIMSELIYLSIVKFQKTEAANIASTSSFTCSCVEEFWIMLIHFIGPKEFWSYFNGILKIILEQKEPPENYVKDCLKIQIPVYFECSNREQFCLWILAQIGELFEYNDEGKRESRKDDIEANFAVLDDIVKKFIATQPSEMLLRNYIPLIHSILNLWKHEKSDSVIYLLEYYVKKLNSAFHISGGRLFGIADTSDSAEGLLEQVKNRLISSRGFENENSFSMFLRLLGEHIEQCGSRSSAAKLGSRIFLQYCPAKIDKLNDLSELGLYHLASLILTMAVVKDTDSLVRKLQESMIALLSKKLTSAKEAMVWKSLTASLILLTEKKSDITGSTENILNQVIIAVSEKDLRSLSIFIDGLKIIFQSKNPQIFILIDDWIGNYLKICSSHEADKLFKICEKIVQDMKINSWFSAEHANQLRERLMKHVFPYIKNQPTQSAAGLLALFVLLLAECHSNKNEVAALHNSWGNNSDVILASRYLCAIMNDDDREQLRMVAPNYPNDVVQCWIKCCILSKDSPEAKQLSEIVIKISPINQICKDYNWNDSSDHLSALINLIGETYKKTETLEEKAFVKETFLSCFNKLDKWVPEEIKKIETLSKETINNLYRYFGEMIEKCGSLLYERSNPHCLLKILLDNLLLPPLIFKGNGLIFPASQISAIFRQLHLYIRGMVNLGPNRDIYIQSCLKNLIIQYFPRFFKCSNDYKLNPFYKAIHMDKSGAVKVAEVIANEFLTVKSKEPHIYSCHAIKLLNEISKLPGGTNTFEVVIGPILNLIMHVKEHHDAKSEALNYLRSFINVPGNHQHLNQKIQEMNERHLAFHTKLWFGLLYELAPIYSQLSSFLPELEKNIEKVEKLRRVQQDQTLRNGLKELKLRLKR